MNGIITTKGQEGSLFIDIETYFFSDFQEYRDAHGTILQRKDEFHITLFSEKYDFIGPTESISNYNRQFKHIVRRYLGKSIGDIELKEEILHIKKGEKQSIIQRIFSQECQDIIQNVCRDLSDILSREIIFFPPLHITLYTDLFSPRGVRLLSEGDIQKYT